MISGYKNDIQASCLEFKIGADSAPPLCVNNPKTKHVMYTPEMTFK